MEVFINDNAYNNKFPITSGMKRRYKETEEGQSRLCEIIKRIREEDKTEGEARVNKLNTILIDMNRFENLKRAAKDKTYQMQLMIELLPEEM